MTETCRRISMWAGPRNVSTAMMYSWRQRSDTTVWDEPLYGHYLTITGADHPGRADILATVPTDADVIVAGMLHGPCPRPVGFSKNMAHHLIGIDIGIIDQLDNFILTRDPRDMLPSLMKGLGRLPTLPDTAYDTQVEIVRRIVNSGRKPIVVDARMLLDDPRAMLVELCRRLRVPFEEAMLSWPRGPKPEDGVWAPHWYGRLHQTTGFEPYAPRTTPLPAVLRDLHRETRPRYEQLLEHALLRPGGPTD